MDTVGIEAVEIPFIPETYTTKKTLVQECCFWTKLLMDLENSKLYWIVFFTLNIFRFLLCQNDFTWNYLPDRGKID